VSAAEILLLRHGETEWNREGRIQGSKDSPLTELGLRQAEQQARILATHLPDLRRYTCYASPLPRAQRTAAIALGEVVPVTDARLRELDCGAWEGLTPAERTAQFPVLAASCKDDFDLYQNAPGGEGLEKLTLRLRAFLDDMQRPTIIVAHKVVLLILRGLLTGRDLPALHSLTSPQGVVIRIAEGQETILAKAASRQPMNGSKACEFSADRS